MTDERYKSSFFFSNDEQCNISSCSNISKNRNDQLKTITYLHDNDQNLSTYTTYQNKCNRRVINANNKYINITKMIVSDNAAVRIDNEKEHNNMTQILHRLDYKSLRVFPDSGKSNE